jgi:hypothetical protein
LAQDDAKLLEKKLRRQVADQPGPKLVLYYESSNRDYSSAANAITASIGEFSEATLLFLFSVSGDGWTEGIPRNVRWGMYRQWRAANGEDRRLSDAPGHQFGPHEAAHLSKVIDFALQLGWDALVAAKPGRQLLSLSHDDRLEIYRGFEWRSLAEKLVALGYWR